MAVELHRLPSEHPRAVSSHQRYANVLTRRAQAMLGERPEAELPLPDGTTLSVRRGGSVRWVRDGAIQSWEDYFSPRVTDTRGGVQITVRKGKDVVAHLNDGRVSDPEGLVFGEVFTYPPVNIEDPVGAHPNPLVQRPRRGTLDIIFNALDTARKQQ